MYYIRLLRTGMPPADIFCQVSGNTVLLLFVRLLLFYIRRILFHAHYSYIQFGTAVPAAFPLLRNMASSSSVAVIRFSYDFNSSSLDPYVIIYIRGTTSLLSFLFAETILYKSLGCSTIYFFSFG